MPDIIIHGASSFIGRHFCRKLINSGYKVIIIARSTSNLEFLGNDELFNILRYNHSIREINPTLLGLVSPVFYEFSWQGVFGSDRNKTDQFTVNIPLIIDSIEFAYNTSSKHWIGIGSQAEYGNINKRVSESDSCIPSTLYGKSKLICSNISAELCKAFNIEHSWLRLFSVFGPDDNHEWLIQYLIKSMLNNDSIQVTKGEQKWDYLYIDDIIRLLETLAEQKSGVGIANLGSGKSISVHEIINLLVELTGTKSTIQIGAIPYRPDQVMFMEADISWLKQKTGWSPKFTVKNGLIETIEKLKSKSNKAK